MTHRRPQLSPLTVTLHRRLVGPLAAAMRRVGAEVPRVEDGPWVIANLAAWWAGVERTTGLENAGLRVAQAIAPGTLGLGEMLFSAAPSLRAGIATGLRFWPLYVDGVEILLRDRGEQCALVTLFPGGRPAPRHAAEFIVGVFYRLGARLGGPADPAPVVRFRHRAPADCTEHRALFTGGLEFGAPEDALVFDRAALTAVPSGADDAVWQALVDHGDAVLRTRDDDASLHELRRHYLDAVAGGDIELARCAARVGVSTRSLQRALKAAGTSHRSLVEACQHQLALRALDDGDAAIPELARQLGFAGASSFTRAFRRWTGTTPAAFRRRRRSR